MKTLATLANEDRSYHAYRKLCDYRYSCYHPNSFKLIDTRVNKYITELDIIRTKLYVCRGYDGIRMLREFY